MKSPPPGPSSQGFEQSLSSVPASLWVDVTCCQSAEFWQLSSLHQDTRAVGARCVAGSILSEVCEQLLREYPRWESCTDVWLSFGERFGTTEGGAIASGSLEQSGRQYTPDHRVDAFGIQGEAPQCRQMPIGLLRDGNDATH